MKVAVIGGGAAGFFAAISVKNHHPESSVVIFEKSSKLLSKVLVSGGGRCNVTHNLFNIKQFSKHYPRGEKFLRTAFNQFSAQDNVNWFLDKGVELKSEPDGRMFPISNTSQTIADCLIDEVQKHQIQIKLLTPIVAITVLKSGFELQFNDNQTSYFDCLIVATGGSNKIESFNWLAQLGHKIEKPLPSLFTFNMPNEKIKILQGVSIANAEVKIRGEQLSAKGPVLITHWGMSGPAILKLSAFGAKLLASKNYLFQVQVNWVGGIKEHQLRELLKLDEITRNKNLVVNKNPFGLPKRMWAFLCEKSEIDGNVTWDSLKSKNFNKLINHLLNDVYEVSGKTTFKVEFVTCGGISLDDVEVESMQSKKVKGLYFAGEVMDIDGVTGGFNFQAAWTTGFIAGKLRK